MHCSQNDHGSAGIRLFEEEEEDVLFVGVWGGVGCGCGGVGVGGGGGVVDLE